MSKLIPQHIITLLSGATIEGRHVRLSGTLDRGVYVQVDKVLKALGGQWDRKAAAHVFPYDAAEVLDPVFLTGNYTDTRVALGQFDTPAELASNLAALAIPVTHGKPLVLEPSAGNGALARAARLRGADVRCVEIDARRAFTLREYGFPVREADFLSIDPDTVRNRFDAVLMNPPFAKQADIDHIRHAVHFLKPGGRLVSVAGAGVAFRQDRKAAMFRSFLEANGGTIQPLPDGSFKGSGTNVNTVVVRLTT
jgi:predicted RNA methylase